MKVVTLRSAYKVENLTLYPLELILVDERGQPVHSVEKIGTCSVILVRALSNFVIPSTGPRLRTPY